MRVFAFFNPSMPEIMSSLLVLMSVAVPVAIGILLWKLLKQTSVTPSSRFSSDAVFTEAIVDDDGVLRSSLPLGPKWAGYAVRVVIEPLHRL